MKKMMFVVVMIAAQFPADCMSPDRRFECPEARCFFENVDDHSRRWQWEDGNSQLKRLTLDFDGRKQFIESVRSKNDRDHINNFTIRVPINSELNVRAEFDLKNDKNNERNKHFSTTYGFSGKDNVWKPYLYDITKRKNGVLDDFVFARPSHPPLYSGYINYFATNVLRILKLSQKPLTTDEPNRINRVANQCVMNTAIEIAAMILTTERARDEYSLLISYIEFYKLKHTNASNQWEMLLNMFFPNVEDIEGKNPILRFPKVKNQKNWRKSKGGASLIQEMKSDEIYNEFIDMLLYTPVYNEYAMLSQDVQSDLAGDFYSDKLDTLNYMLYGDHTKSKHTFKIKLKKAYDDYIWNEILPMHIGL